MGWFGRNNSVQEAQAEYYRTQTRLAESIFSYYDQYVDPMDALRDDDTGELWQEIGQVAGNAVLPMEQLDAIRDECRALALVNEFAINGHENRISYIVGSGHGYTVAPKQGIEISEDRLQGAQDIIDEFVDEADWRTRQQEIVRRKDRDGEAFLRFFPTQEGFYIRFVEPEDVKTPNIHGNDPNESQGIRTAPGDVETVRGYWINGEVARPSEIQHRKLGVDFNVKRGLPLYYSVRKNLKRAEKLLRNMSTVAGVQAAIAMIRKHMAGTKTSIEDMVTSTADASITSQKTGTTSYHRQYPAGTVLDVLQGTEYDFPSHAIDAGRFVTILQAELRAVASRLVMPEFMLTSDASNANYASTMVAEGPAVKMFTRMQWEMIEDDRQVMNRVLDAAVDRGRLDLEIRAQIELDVQPPTIAVRDREKEVAADVRLVEARIMSKRTAMLKNDLDPDVEEEQIAAEREESDPFVGMEFGNNANIEDEEEEEES
jgi:hypothetical protein